ncbi:MAG: lamin tail domain-containing protein [Candidatus Paceibacterota bacterium]|jgi:hypothetical protein
MSKSRIIFVLVGIVFFFGFKYSSASVIINEIMYDVEGSDTDREWIEIYNNGSESIDLSGWKLNEANTNHSIAVFQGENSLGANSYAIVVGNPQKFLIDWSNFLGTIFDSSFSLNNDPGEFLALKDSSLSIKDELTYTTSIGAAGDGNSLQLINGEWKAGSPTPGASNESSSGSDNTTNTGNNDDTNITNNIEDNNTDTNTNEDFSTETTTETKTTIKNPTMKAKILTKTLAFIGQPLEFKSSILGYSNENLVLGKIFWNFGDGSSLEQNNNFTKFNHTYLYSGEYPVSMEYYSNYFLDTPDAVNKIIIKVVPMTVSISKVGDAKDFFVELTNNSNYEIDISKWTLNANGKVFVFPKNSVIMSKKAITISGKITGFVLGDEKNLKLISGTGEIVFDYNSLFSNNEIVVEPVKTSVKNYAIKNEIENTVEDKMPDTTNQAQISDTDLSAIAVLGDTQIKGTNNYLFFGIFGVLLALVGVGVYFIRKKGSVSNIKEGNDFEILDE